MIRTFFLKIGIYTWPWVQTERQAIFHGKTVCIWLAAIIIWVFGVMQGY